MTLKKLGRFEILREIGKGAMGQVFLAHDPKIDRHVAIKTIVLPPGTSEDEARETSERFLREAQAAGKLLHPNIVTIFDVGEEDGISFIAMEYIDGSTLEKHTRSDQLLVPARVLDLIGQAAAALDHAHTNKIVHRDVKPANLMIMKNGVLKVTDFGLAKNPSANLTQAGVLLGTPSYMSPEQIQGRELDGRSDLFSLGVVLYELLTGVRPFDGDSISTIIYKVLYEDPRPPASYNPALPPDVNVLLEKALAKDPESRYRSCAELAAALNKAFALLPPETLSKPFPVVRKGESHVATAVSPVRTSVRSPRAGAARRGSAPRPVRKPRSDRAGYADRQTMIAHHPAKIAAVVGIALAGLVVFPRWVNRQEWTPPEQRVAAVPARGDLVVTPAGIGSPPSGASSRSRRGQVTIEVETIPHGGRVFVDDIPLAEPRVVLSLGDPQEHDIVARAGCRQAIAAMTAADLESFSGPLVLELTPRKEEVLVDSIPPGARIRLNRRDTGKTTPATFMMEACEPRSISLHHDEFRAWSAEYPTDSDFDEMVDELKGVQLASIPKGSILIRKPKEYDVEIFKGEQRLGMAGDTIELLEGDHTFEFRNATFFVRERLKVTVRGNRTVTPMVAFPSLGTLTVQAQPSNCKVYVDGKYVDVTPIIEMPIASGGHRVRVIFVPNGSEQEVPVTVHGTKNARVVVKF